MRVEIPNQISVKIGGIISRGVKAVEVSDEGKLIFTLTDGSTVDLGSVIGPEGQKGETGPEGPAGPAGVKGDTGAAGASIMSIEKSSQSGTTSTYTITMSDGQTFDFEVQSDKGEKGDKGDTGATGPKGPQGEQGPAGIVVQETEPTGPEHPVWVNPKGGASDPSISGKDGTTFTPSVSASGDLSWTNDGGKENPETVNIKGPQGSPGITPNIQIGTVTTLPAGSDATASVSGTAENPLLNLGIPKGADGSSGSSAITTATETDIAGLLMGEGGKVRKAVPDVDYLKTKELPTPVPSNDSGKYLRWFDGDGWHLESLDLYTCNVVDANGQYYCDQSPSDIQALVTAGKTIFAMLSGEPYLLTSLSAQAAVFTRVAGTTVTTITVSTDYTAARTTTELQPAGGSGGTDLSLGMTSAAVGQIAKITAVDETGKPTQWEPVEMAGGGGGETWEIINEVTLSEDAMSVVFDKDKSGAAFFLRKFVVVGTTKGSDASNTTGGAICINVANTADDMYSIVPPIHDHAALKGDQLRYWHASAEILAEKGWRWYITAADNTWKTGQIIIGTSLREVSQIIPKVATYLALWSRASGSAFAAGSKIKLYGVRT